MKEDVIILIPAYNPDEKLVELVKDLSKTNKIIVVDDGSTYKKIFEDINQYCCILENIKNLGKGRALKKGFYYIMKNYPNIKGVVTADADGQHILKDIENIKKKVIEEKDKFILGYRNLKGKKIPIRSKIGNISINTLFKLKTKIKIKDTQTGLRGIPMKYLNDCISISGEKYDYELNVLKYLCKKHINFIEIPIETVYLKEIKSKFKPLKDSILILKKLINN